MTTVATGVKDNTELLAAFRLDQTRRGLTPSTIDARSSRLRTFARWLDPTPLANASTEDVQRFLDQRRIGSRTRYCWISHLHAFYAAVERADLAAGDPTAVIARPRLRRLLPRPISDADLAHAIDQADRDVRCWLLLMAYGGLRCAEVGLLERADVCDTNEEPILLVHGKGDKPRVVPAHPDVLDGLSGLPMPRNGRVFRRPRGGAWPAQRISRRVCLFFDELGIDATPHQLRHWFGTHLYAVTKDLRLVQEVMGHSSPNTTAGYTYWSGGEASVGVRKLAIAPSV